jgi:hypothetical protein
MRPLCGACLIACWAAATISSGQVVLSSYLGGPGDDTMTGAAVLSDGTIVVAGTMPDAELKPSERIPGQEGRGDGFLLRLSADGKKVLSVTRLDGAIGDLDADAEGNVYVTGAFGSAKLNGRTGRRVWQSNVGGEGARIVAGPKGCAAILSEKRIMLVEADGSATKTWLVEADHVNDIACDTQNNLIFVTGFHNRWGTPPGQKDYPVQVAFVYAFDYNGKKVWAAYDWKGQEAADLHLMADTRGYRLFVGADGKLYVAGESAGGNTIWSRRSQDLKTELPLAKGDKYQVPFNTAANHITFVGRLDPKTGNTEAGTMLLARLSNNRGNTIRPRALAADESGRVYVGGASASYPPMSPNASGGDFEGGGAFFCVFDRDFKRLYATKLCSGTTAAIGVGERIVVAVGDGSANLKTVNPLQAEAAGGKSDGWLVVFAERP